MDLMTGTKRGNLISKGVLSEPTIWPTVAYDDCHVDRPNSGVLSGACCGMCCNTSVRDQQPVETGAAPAASHNGTRTPPRAPGSGDGIMPSFDISLIGRAGDAIIAGRAAPGATWNCCATASSMIEWSQINPDNSSWSLPSFLLGIMS